MKTFIYYSPSKKDVIAIVAENTLMACGLLLEETKSIMSNDYYLTNSVEHKIGKCGTFSTEMFDTLLDAKNESELNALENQSNEC